jgi:putative transposase
MALPRSKYVLEGEEGVYHCFSRCVRRAFLYGFDRLTGRNFCHRKAWLVDRLRHLAGIFAVEVCAYSVMENHYHTILRTRPDIAEGWADREVAARWLTLYPKYWRIKDKEKPSIEDQVEGLASCPNRIATLRKRLSNLSWFMGRLNEFMARAANKEDAVKGRFWESRFKCKALLDDAAIVSGMVYVDLNPIRVGRAETPEDSNFTSIKERILAWRKKNTVPAEKAQNTCAGYPCDASTDSDNGPVPGCVSAGDWESDWLCPIASESGRRGILPMTPAEYFDLVDRSGRMIQTGKKGAIDADLAPILHRLGADPNGWPDTVAHFGDRFRLVVGKIPSLREFADRVSRRWFTGIAAARTAFTAS